MRNQHHFLGMLSAALRGLGHAVQSFPILVLTALLASPVGPHFRTEYTYRDVYGHRSYVSCSYLGSRGVIASIYIEGCPFIAWLDSRKWR